MQRRGLDDPTVRHRLQDTIEQGAGDVIGLDRLPAAGNQHSQRAQQRQTKRFGWTPLDARGIDQGRAHDGVAGIAESADRVLRLALGAQIEVFRRGIGAQRGIQREARSAGGARQLRDAQRQVAVHCDEPGR